MSIVISIVKLPDSAVNTKATHTFAYQGGTIGRSSENEWVLEDEERFISSQHSKISFENGQYYITDLSTNGTFSNGSPEPIGKGNTVPLKDGDKFSLGDYEFLASVWQSENDQAENLSQGPFASNIPDSTPKPAEQPRAAQFLRRNRIVPGEHGARRGARQCHRSRQSRAGLLAPRGAPRAIRNAPSTAGAGSAVSRPPGKRDRADHARCSLICRPG